MYFHLRNIRRYFRRRSEPGVPTSAGGSVKSTERERASRPSGGLFSNANNFSINNPQMNDLSHAQIQHNVYQTIMHGDATLERLHPYTCTDAGVNSSARYPPPRCHEGTREKVGEKLKIWFHDPKRRWKAMWLYGPAGTGKSAVAQTFAEYCEAKKSLGASFFFSRPNHRDKYETVVPTIAYQLAISIPSYRAELMNAIAVDPTILDKASRVQLRQLIVEPFSALHARNDPMTQKPLLIVLDGLDECHGLKGQIELVEMINEVNQLAHLPFLWLVCSRPEPHLMYIFSRAIESDRHQLMIDADTRRDVEKYLRDGFTTIQIELLGTVDESWPAPELFKRIVDITDGLFALGTAILGYIGNTEYANPNQRLIDFLAFMGHACRIATDNPLETLDLLYSRILMDVPASVMPTTRRILHHCIYDISPGDAIPVQVLANFLHMNQQEFYSALRPLHSVLEIPSPENAADVPLHMYHASFKDYLCSPSRAGRFFISEEEARAQFSKSRFFWYNIILEDQVSDDNFAWYTYSESPSIFPHLKWTSSTPEPIAEKVNYSTYFCIHAWEHLCHALRGSSAEIYSFCDGFKFQFMELLDALNYNFLQFLNWLFQQDVPGNVLRSEPTYDLDRILLKSVIERFSMYDLKTEPMVFPLVECEGSLRMRRYCFLGKGMKTCLFWTDEDLGCLGRARFSCEAVLGGVFTNSDCVLHAYNDGIFNKERKMSEGNTDSDEGGNRDRSI